MSYFKNKVKITIIKIMLHCVKLKWKLHLYTPLIKTKSVASNLSFFTFNTKNSTNLFYINIYGYHPVEYYIIHSTKMWMQRARHDFISGKQDVSDSMWRWQRSALARRRGVHRFVNFVVYFLSCLGRCNKRPSHIILLNRSIVHAIRPHVSEVWCSGMVSAHTTCVLRPSPTEPSLAHLLQPSQGLLNKPRPSVAWSDHISQTNRALGLRHAQNIQCGYTFRK